MRSRSRTTALLLGGLGLLRCLGAVLLGVAYEDLAALECLRRRRREGPFEHDGNAVLEQGRLSAVMAHGDDRALVLDLEGDLALADVVHRVRPHDALQTERLGADL